MEQSKYFLLPGETEADLTNRPAYEEVDVKENLLMTLRIYREYRQMGGEPVEPLESQSAAGEVQEH